MPFPMLRTWSAMWRIVRGAPRRSGSVDARVVAEVAVMRREKSFPPPRVAPGAAGLIDQYGLGADPVGIGARAGRRAPKLGEPAGQEPPDGLRGAHLAPPRE